jgi:hypothetical protein
MSRDAQVQEPPRWATDLVATAEPVNSPRLHQAHEQADFGISDVGYFFVRLVEFA